MERKILRLEDDMKEYWGFYLLKDSHYRSVVSNLQHHGVIRKAKDGKTCCLIVYLITVRIGPGPGHRVECFFCNSERGVLPINHFHINKHLEIDYFKFHINKGLLM